jgi:predicted GNAT family acetyltransferase
MWLWENEAGVPTSLAARQRTTAGAARIGPVYTPPEHRRHGYGAAVTAACTRDALRSADGVVLFTDLANPVSNSIYQQIGYLPVTDRAVIRFAD